jgi:hypothetical protein
LVPSLAQRKPRTNGRISSSGSSAPIARVRAPITTPSSARTERRRDGPAAPELLSIIAKYVGGSEASARGSIAYVDADARLDEPDIRRQVEWYQSQHMVNGGANAVAMLDARYAVPLPARDAVTSGTEGSPAR